MGLGICVVGVGLITGISYNNLKVELVYLISGLLLFFAGQLVTKKKA
jgi:hypothetical protein